MIGDVTIREHLLELFQTGEPENAEKYQVPTVYERDRKCCKIW